MHLRSLLIAFLVYGLYPAWLAAGVVDYFCHRESDIAHTSGTRESWLHVGQFATIALMLAVALLLDTNALALALMLFAVVLHTVLAYVDVAYTQKRRHISPLEQHVHGFLNVIPLIAVALIAVLHWGEIQASQFVLRWESQVTARGAALMLGSLAVLGGIPVAEELLRTFHGRSALLTVATTKAAR